MTSWMNGHYPVFKAAVSGAAVNNLVDQYVLGDGGLGRRLTWGSPFAGDNLKRYIDQSPITYVKNVKTPTLVLHSDNDFRVPIEQGEQWFRALRHFGVPSEIVFFPRENHNLTRTGEPKHLVESINWQVYWFDRYINGNAHAVPPDAPARTPATGTQDRP